MESLMYLKIDAFRQNTKKEKKRKEKKRMRSLVESYLPLSTMNYMKKFLIGQ